MLTNTAVIRTGRLLEIRADAGYTTAADVDRFFEQIASAVAGPPPPGEWVTVADWRSCPLMAPVAAERMVQRIAGANDRTIRSAALARRSAPSAVLQFVRLIREAGLADRKLFFDAEELIDWLSGVLTQREAQRLRAFIEGSA